MENEGHIEELTIEGRNPVAEAFKADKTIDKLYILEGCHDGPLNSIVRKAKKQGVIINFVPKERLDQISKTGKHQGVIAHAAAYEYSTVDEIMEKAREKGKILLLFF